MSNAITCPLFSINAAKCKLFPPAPAQVSTTLDPGLGFKNLATFWEEASWTSNQPFLKASVTNTFLRSFNFKAYWCISPQPEISRLIHLRHGFPDLFSCAIWSFLQMWHILHAICNEKHFPLLLLCVSCGLAAIKKNIDFRRKIHQNNNILR